jgi:hypothetical protein
MNVGAPEAACPKCGRARPDGAETCSRCGLQFARWSSDPGEPVLPLDDRGERLWAELGQRWNDESLHDAFVKHCSSSGRLTAAGRLYRACLDRDPGNTLASKMQTRIVGMAVALLTPSPAAPTPVVRRAWFVWVLVAGAVGGLLASLVLRAIRS